MPHLKEHDTTKHLIIGAGFVGLGMAKALRAFGIAYDHVEADRDIGGNWLHGVYPHVHIISSKRTTEFPDFPMPEAYPDFPSASQVLNYLHSYCNAFDLRTRIEFRKKVTSIVPRDDAKWTVCFADGEVRVYKGVLTCNGHHWDPRWPKVDGDFLGTYIHSKQYKSDSVLADQRVLVIGGGNSACDIIVDAARVAKRADLSLRSGYWFLPKTVLGKPLVEMTAPWIPIWLQKLVLRLLLRIVVGPYESYGLPRPKHDLFTKHPTVNSLLLYYLKHGVIRPRNLVERFSGKRVYFHDGSSDEYDVIVAATGYHVSFPFLSSDIVEVRGSIPQIPAGAVHPRYRGLYIVGWAQVRYGVGPLVTAGAPVVCELIKAQERMRYPVGFLMGKLGVGIPDTHLADPMRSLRQYRRQRWLVRWLPLAERLILRQPAAGNLEPGCEATRKATRNSDLGP